MSGANVDWPRLLDDIAYLLGDRVHPDSDLRQAVGTPTLADHLGMSRGAVRNMLDGTEPRYADGRALIAVWCRLTGKAEVFIPLQRQQLSASKVR